MLDVGCGDGALLAWLRDHKGVDGRGVEIDPVRVASAVARGLSVIQADAEAELADWPAGSVDYAILSETLQAMQAPHRVLEQLLRIGARAVVAFPNFGHWRARLHLLLKGRMPVTKSLPVSWYETDNIHFCTVDDFRDLVRTMGLAVEAEAHLSDGRRVPAASANWRADTALFVLRRG